MQFDTSAVIFENTPDNRQTKTGALLTRGDIRLKQPCATFLGQPNSVINNIDHDVVVLARSYERRRSLPCRS